MIAQQCHGENNGQCVLQYFTIICLALDMVKQFDVIARNIMMMIQKKLMSSCGIVVYIS